MPYVVSMADGMPPCLQGGWLRNGTSVVIYREPRKGLACPNGLSVASISGSWLSGPQTQTLSLQSSSPPPAAIVISSMHAVIDRSSMDAMSGGWRFV